LLTYSNIKKLSPPVAREKKEKQKGVFFFSFFVILVSLPNSCQFTLILDRCKKDFFNSYLQTKKFSAF